MRTTLTLDPDVVRLIEDAVHRDRSTFKETVNEALRRGLSTKKRRPFRVQPHPGGLLPGLDPRRLNQLADEFEDEAILSSMTSVKRRK